MLIRLFGPFLVGPIDAPVAVGGPKQAAVLAQLVVARGRVVAEESLVDGIWGEDPPPRARATIQVNISNLRKALRGSGLLIERVGAGYRLTGAETDLARVENRRAHGGAEALREAAALLAGPPLADLRTLPFSDAVAPSLEEISLLTREDLIDAELALGRHRDVVGAVEDLVSAHPTRERLWAQLMLGLYRCDRQADALNAFQRARSRLADELGIDPGTVLRDLEVAILRQDHTLEAPTGHVTGAPTTAPSPVARALPLAPTELIGREDEVAVLLGRLQDPAIRLLTLTGTGGVGKSRLAIAVARLAEGDHDLATWVSLVDVTDGTDVPERVADALGLESADDLATALLGRATLLVLDNLEQIPDAGVAVAALLAEHPSVTVLATSRIPVNAAAEQVHPVPPLALSAPDGTPAAVRLFEARARATDPRFTVTPDNLADVTTLCHRLDGLPFAIELAAARVRLLRPAAILERLDLQPDAALGRATADTPERHRSVTRAIQWSLDLLGPGADDLLVRLGVFAGGFTTDAADAICGDDTGDVLGLLSDLLDANLLHPEPSAADLRFRLYSLVRDHLRVHVDAVAPELAERHARWYAARADSLAAALDGPGSSDATAQIGDDLAEYQQAVAWGCVRHPELAVGMVEALSGYWVATGAMIEGLSSTDTVLEAVTDTDLRARTQARRGQLLYYLTDWDEVRRSLEPLVLDESGASYATAAAFLAGTCAITGEPDRARLLAGQALVRAREQGDRTAESVALAARAIAAAVEGDVATERELHRERLTLARRHGDRPRVVDTLNTLAEIALDESDPVQARGLLAEALDLCGELMLPERRDLLISAARVDLVEGHTEDAVDRLRQAWPLVRRLGQSLALAQLLRTLAGVCLAQDKVVDAARMLGAAATLQPGLALATEQVERDLAGYVEQVNARLGAGVDAQVAAGSDLHPADVAARVESLLSDRPSAS